MWDYDDHKAYHDKRHGDYRDNYLFQVQTVSSPCEMMMVAKIIMIIKMMIIMMIIFFKSRHVRTTIENSNQYVFVTTTLHNNFDDIDNESAERVGRTSSWKCLQLSLQHSLGEVAILRPATPPSLPLSPSSPSPPVAQSSSPSSPPPPSGPFLDCNHQGYQDQNISQDQDWNMKMSR